MTNTEFKTKLIEAFKNHILMNKRDRHTVNELLYVLRYEQTLNCLGDCNISIRKKNGEWWSIPTLDSFVSISCLSVWFEDEQVEFEVEEFDGNQYNCITIYESEEK